MSAKIIFFQHAKHNLQLKWTSSGRTTDLYLFCLHFFIYVAKVIEIEVIWIPLAISLTIFLSSSFFCPCLRPSFDIQIDYRPNFSLYFHLSITHILFFVLSCLSPRRTVLFGSKTIFLIIKLYKTTSSVKDDKFSIVFARSFFYSYFNGSTIGFWRSTRSSCLFCWCPISF